MGSTVATENNYNKRYQLTTYDKDPVVRNIKNKNIMRQKMALMTDGELMIQCYYFDTWSICHDVTFWIDRFKQRYPTFPNLVIDEVEDDDYGMAYMRAYFGLIHNDADAVHTTIDEEYVNHEFRQWL